MVQNLAGQALVKYIQALREHNLDPRHEAVCPVGKEQPITFAFAHRKKGSGDTDGVTDTLSIIIS